MDRGGGRLMHETRLLTAAILIAIASSSAAAQMLPDQPDITSASVSIAPPAPPTPAQLPPSLPKVVCSGDQLTISAENSTLESILAAVRNCTGAKIEVPAGAATTRTFEELGPGPIRRVLDALLSGTEFNYVIESSDADPKKLQSVLLSERKKEPGSGAAAAADIALTPARRAWMQSRQQGRPDSSSDDNSEPAPAEVSAAETHGGSSGPAQAANGVQSPANDTSAEVVPPAPPPVASTDPVKATEDKITSMQQMFDQRRQMIEKQNGTSGSSSTPN